MVDIGTDRTNDNGPDLQQLTIRASATLSSLGTCAASHQGVVRSNIEKLMIRIFARMKSLPAGLILLTFMTSDLVWGAQPYRSKHAMVVSGETNATNIGLSVLQSGGNAIDAAVAMGFALGVTHSGMTGLGGGGYILVRMADGRTTFLDFREQAPGKASRNMFLDAKGNLSADSVTGWKAAAVPGNVKGYEVAHQKFCASAVP